QTLANAYGCEGDATCPDEFRLPLGSIPGIAGENVLAVEVHNYSLKSADITFGLSLDHITPIARTVRLNAELSGGQIKLSWEGSGFRLQSANSPTGPWTDVQAATGNPFVVAI